MKNVLGTRTRPLEPIKNKALVTVAGSLQEKHVRGADGEAVPKTTTNHRYVKSIVDTKVAFGDTLAKPSNSNLTAAHSSKLLGALPLGKGSADIHPHLYTNSYRISLNSCKVSPNHLPLCDPPHHLLQGLRCLKPLAHTVPWIITTIG